MTKAWILALAVLAVPASGASTEGGSLLHAEGRLLVGAGGLEVGDPAGPLPRGTNATGPVTHAVHGFQVPECPHFLGVKAQAHALGVPAPVWEETPAFDPSLIEVEIRTPNGTTVAGEFGHDFAFMTDEPVGPGPFELHVVHLVGGPIRYQATVDGGRAPSCP